MKEWIYGLGIALLVFSGCVYRGRIEFSNQDEYGKKKITGEIKVFTNSYEKFRTAMENFRAIWKEEVK